MMRKFLSDIQMNKFPKSSVSTWSEDTIIQGFLIKFSTDVTVDDLPGLVLKQITYGFDESIKEATASIEKVVPIKSGNETIYRIFLNNESIIGNFLPTNQTISRTTFGPNNQSIVVDSTVGFPEINGEFYVEGINDAVGDPISFSYKEKTATEFYGIVHHFPLQVYQRISLSMVQTFYMFALALIQIHSKRDILHLLDHLV